MEVRYFEGFKIQGDEIVSPLSLQQLTASVQAGDFLVLKKVFSSDLVYSIIDQVHESFREEEPAYRTIQWGTRNHWRIDDRPTGATPKVQSIYFPFLWNDELPEVRKVARSLGVFRNRLAGLADSFGFSKEDSHYAIPCLQKYPKGCGYQATHRDPIEPQKVVVSLTLSTLGKDYDEGGLYIETEDGERVNMDRFLEPGDISLMAPGAKHGVAVVDPEFKSGKDFHSKIGRWRMSTILSDY